MMDYDAIVTQALALLQREQRLSYRVLKLRLQLEDDLLEALKEDLIYAKQLAMDEDGRVLVWTGGTSRAPTTASPMPPPAVAPAQGEASPIDPVWSKNPNPALPQHLRLRHRPSCGLLAPR